MLSYYLNFVNFGVFKFWTKAKLTMSDQVLREVLYEVLHAWQQMHEHHFAPFSVQRLGYAWNLIECKK